MYWGGQNEHFVVLGELGRLFKSCQAGFQTSLPVGNGNIKAFFKAACIKQ